VTPPPQQQLLLPGGPSGLPSSPDVVAVYGPPPADGITPIATSGRTEYAVECPGCGQHHRHTRPGVRRAPCGRLYTVPSAQAVEGTARPD
jgi:hypothetical protein